MNLEHLKQKLKELAEAIPLITEPVDKLEISKTIDEMVKGAGLDIAENNSGVIQQRYTKYW